MNPWIPRALDLAVALVAGAGLVLILAAALARRPSFVDRVAQGRVQERPPSALAAWARRVSASTLDTLGSTSESVARRLALAGMNPDVSVFRLRQAVAGVAGLVAACALVAARHASSLRASLVPLCACALVGTLLGVAGMDRFLTVRARARQRAIDAAVPDCSELLALAVAAGESIPAAIERVAGCAGGPLGAELLLTAGHIRNGTPSVRALADLVERTESPALTRLSRTLTTAIERGSPLAAVLHDQARDQRERSRRHSRRRRRGEQAEQAVRAPQVGQQAQHARRQRHRAHRPRPREELLRHGQRAPPQHAGALEHAQDGEGARSRSSQEKIACREHVEHAPPRPSSSPATPHCRNAAIHWYYSTARAKRTAKGRGFGMLRHTESKHAVVILSAAPKARSRRIPSGAIAHRMPKPWPIPRAFPATISLRSSASTATICTPPSA